MPLTLEQAYAELNAATVARTTATRARATMQTLLERAEELFAAYTIDEEDVTAIRAATEAARDKLQTAYQEAIVAFNLANEEVLKLTAVVEEPPAEPTE